MFKDNRKSFDVLILIDVKENFCVNAEKYMKCLIAYFVPKQQGEQQQIEYIYFLNNPIKENI